MSNGGKTARQKEKGRKMDDKRVNDRQTDREVRSMDEKTDVGQTDRDG